MAQAVLGAEALLELLWKNGSVKGTVETGHFKPLLSLPHSRNPYCASFEVHADLGMLYEKRLWNCYGGGLGGPWSRRSILVELPPFLGALATPQTSWELGRFLNKPCLKFTRSLLKETKKFRRMFLPHWIGIFLIRKKRCFIGKIPTWVSRTGLGTSA